MSQGAESFNTPHFYTTYQYFFDFSVDYDGIDVGDILDIHKYLMKNHDTK